MIFFYKNIDIKSYRESYIVQAIFVVLLLCINVLYSISLISIIYTIFCINTINQSYVITTTAPLQGMPHTALVLCLVE